MIRFPGFSGEGRHYSEKETVLLIGVIAKENEREVVSEFFELFKTPWEFYQERKEYDVVVCSKDHNHEIRGKLLMIFGGSGLHRDEEWGTNAKGSKKNRVLNYKGERVPVYGDVLTFDTNEIPLLSVKETGDAAAVEFQRQGQKIIRFGFNLFEEVKGLLLGGQSTEYAMIPTLDMHISILRESILKSGVELLEVPPVPKGYDFICCLTHDVDFAGIGPHFFDRTMFGFVYRGLIGSMKEFLRGRISGNRLWKNWMAVGRLPAVYAGLVEDFWLEFRRYQEIEKDIGSTYFFIPFKNRPGQGLSGPAPKSRACKYDVRDVKDEVDQLNREGCEIGVHGIDAWRDPGRGREEYQRISQISGQHPIGVRMHWLYFDSHSPEILESSGFKYDSTFGYNEALGFRAGTTQVFRPPGVKELLELPLHIQDTALFYPHRMNLTDDEAFERVKQIIEITERVGGVLTLNWHTRSLSPERQWDGFYMKLLDQIKKRRVWFGTAQQVVNWFRKRRSVSFSKANGAKEEIHLHSDNPFNTVGPDLDLKIHSK